MNILPRWRLRFSTLHNDAPKNPWGDGDSSGGGGDGDGGAGPRNPWATPPGGRPRGPSALDELISRAKRRGGGGGGGSGGGGFPGGVPSRSVWALGAGLVVAAWLILTSVHPIQQQQLGVVTVFGKYWGTIRPGIGMTMPAPIAEVTKVDVKAIRTEDFPNGTDAENLMLTSDQNILNLGFSVRWNISNPEDFAFQIAEPVSTVRSTAESAMREVVANMTLDEAMGRGRTRIQAQVQDRMQRVLNDYNSGIQVLGVAVKQAVPPAQVNDAFKGVTAAQQAAITAKNQAQGYAQQLVAKAQGDAAQFDKIYGQYKLAPEVTRRRMYYETMEDVLSKTDKTIVETPGVMPYLPLDKIRKAPDAAAQGQGQ